MTAADLATALARQPRVRLATLPTALEPAGALPGGARLLVKRDDLTGLGLGGNKARKLEFLCGDALAAGADTLVTVGADQSNHARMTAAAGAVLGLETHLVLGGDAPSQRAGNQLLAELFGAHIHHAGTDDWTVLEEVLDALVDDLVRRGRTPYRMPMGGSTPVGALGFVAAWIELLEQCAELGVEPAAVVHASSTGGTHAGLLAGAAATGPADPGAAIVAVDVAKAGDDLVARAGELAGGALELLGLPDAVAEDAIELDRRWTGPSYGVPTPASDAAILHAARSGAWVLDRTYTGKAFAGLLGAAADGRFREGDTVVFWHTGGQPAVFAPGGSVQVPAELQEIA
jgi:1-aminocyclopropane-1-carboxylate deaminase/D-cysteine desulfhydrase-like pyridoxal-dependent ACC family enzyme